MAEIETTTKALKPMFSNGPERCYRVAHDVALDPKESAAVKFWAEQAGTLFRVVLRWRAAQGKAARQEEMRGSRELQPGDCVELEVENRHEVPTIVNVFCYVRLARAA